MKLKGRLSTILLFGILSIVANTANGQKTKKVEIYKNNLYKDYVNAYYNYDKENQLESLTVSLFGQDLRYQQLVELVVIYSGTPSEFLNYMNSIEEFFNENDPDTSTEIEGHLVNIVKQSGIKGFYIYELDQSGSGYRGYNMKTWNKIKTGFTDWANKNKIPLE